LNAAKRDEGGRKASFMITHMHEAHPEFEIGSKTALIMLNVCYARILRRHLKSVRALLPTPDRLKDAIRDVRGSLEKASPFGVRRLIERVSLVGFLTLKVAVVRHQGH
jgi:hypothetical protein